jgi:hypothetical protein
MKTPMCPLFARLKAVALMGPAGGTKKLKLLFNTK